MFRIFIFLLSAFLLASCSSIQPIGVIGPKKLNVVEIASNGFLSANRTLVILDKKGNVVAYTGGTVTGGGTVAIQALASIGTATSIYYGAAAIQKGLQNASIKGIPSHVTVDTSSSFSIKNSGDAAKK